MNDTIPSALPIARPAGPYVIDIALERPRVAYGRRIGLFFVTIFLTVACAVFAARSFRRSPIVFVVPFAVYLISMLGSFRLSKVLTRRSARRIASDPALSPAAAVQAIAMRKSLTGGIHALLEAMRVLVVNGRTGETFRICPPKLAQPTAPIQFPFEPRLLDEADSAFAEIDHASAAPDQRMRAAKTADDLGLRRVKRNLMLRGGPARLIVPVLFLLRAAFESYHRGFMTWNFWFWCAIMAMILFLPRTGNLFKGMQWYIVQGGLVLRRRAGGLHIFDRRQSNLCVYRTWREQWRVAIADAEHAETLIATRRECDVLLRAWLSPIPPPAMEQLASMINAEQPE